MGETLEELRKENELLRKDIEAIELAKAKREQDEMKNKIEADKKLELQRHDEELLARHGVTSKSKIEDGGSTSQAMNLSKDNEHIEFGNNFIRRLKNRGYAVSDKPLGYDRLIEKLAYKEYAKVK